MAAKKRHIMAFVCICPMHRAGWNVTGADEYIPLSWTQHVDEL